MRYVILISTTRKGKKMTRAEILNTIEKAEADRKKAYQVKAPRFIIQSINSDIRNLSAKLRELEA